MKLAALLADCQNGGSDREGGGVDVDVRGDGMMVASRVLCKFCASGCACPQK